MADSQITGAIAADNKQNIELARKIYAAMKSAMIEGMAKDGELYVEGLGRFLVRTRKARTIFQPYKKTFITYPARTVVFWIPATSMRDALN